MYPLTLSHVSDKTEFHTRFDRALSDRVSSETIPQLSLLAWHFFHVIAIEELNQRREQDLLGCTLHAWNLLQTLKSPKVSVFNPDYEKDGWQSTHTAVFILHEDCPFLVDSVRTEVTRRGYTIHVLQNCVLHTRRDKQDNLLGLVDEDLPGEKSEQESLMFLEIDRCATRSELAELEAAISDVLAEVRQAVADHQAMKTKVLALRDQLLQGPSVHHEDERHEASAFLDWMLDDRFTFLGYEEFCLEQGEIDAHIVFDNASLLGLARRLRGTSDRHDVTPPVAEHLRKPMLLSFAKHEDVSRVHRPAYPDLVSVRLTDAEGRVVKECRFIGIFAGSTSTESVRQIPLIRGKVRQIAERSGFIPGSHLSRSLLKVLEALPRDDLFQTTTKALLRTCVAIVRIQERAQVRLFLRTEPFGRFVHVLAYVPREIYSTEIRKRIQDVLTHRLGAVHSEFWTSFSESVLARVQFILKVDPAKVVSVDAAALEQEVILACRGWQDEYRTLVAEHFGEAAGMQLLAAFSRGFPAGYRERFSPHSAVVDLHHLASLDAERSMVMRFYQPSRQVEGTLHCKLYHSERPLHLSDVLPVLENLGLRVIEEFPYQLQRANHQSYWIHDFTFIAPTGSAPDLEQLNEQLQEAFVRIIEGVAENDGFNRLVLSAGIGWRDVALLRAQARYLKQIRLGFDLSYVAATLVNHGDVACDLVRLFHNRFQPGLNDFVKRDSTQAVLEQGILSALENVAVLNEDRILRRYLDLTKATLRTNFFQCDGAGKPKTYLSFKLAPRQIPEMPAPAPMFEIFVYSPRFEGVHLRAGKVARGGLRWSDREEDYRTEVLGLVKAQQVKNSVIVPVGAKGGFVPRRLPVGGTRDDVQQEAIACYQLFIKGLLDVTDNLSEGQVVSPVNVVRHDEDDPYLVVAADKGTATFSDIANNIASEYRFWLGDAFASGGSAGYDHKGMGITAKGGWVSVERHFHELGLDVSRDPITVVGIGDMAGDVFGNGMLLSSSLELVAAFNHQHIFIDPNPDAASSFAERQRLFALPRSSWEDYQKDLLSAGGGVHLRSAKYIEISGSVRERFKIEESRLSPNELIRRLLQAPVDLIWNGGIGTYVKSSAEQHADVGDKANDSLRVDGCDVRARVVGEGGNLGMTQLGRIEYGLQGGRSNTDFIDNAGGVDCSDHEVNIKILLNERVRAGDLTLKQRNLQLSRMTDAVSGLVLQNNFKQTQALSLAEHGAARSVNDCYDFIEILESKRKLDRALEFLPSKEQVSGRELAALTRPELAVLISYSKIDLKEQLLQMPLADQGHLLNDLRTAFPAFIHEQYTEVLNGHPLKAEIIATQLANDLVNHMGITFVSRLQRLTGVSAGEVAMAYVAVRDIYCLPHWFAEIERGASIAPGVKLQFMQSLIEMAERAVAWILRHRPAELRIDQEVERFSKGVNELITSFIKLQSPAQQEQHDLRRTELLAAGCTPDLAAFVAVCHQLHSLLPVVETARTTQRDATEVARVHFSVGEALDLEWYQRQIDHLQVSTAWQNQARESMRDELDSLQREIAVRIMDDLSSDIYGAQRVEQWICQRPQLVQRWLKTLGALRDSSEADFAMFSVAQRELLRLAQQ